jgi:antitoxin (DNA-binding transcriptional repressor) of toxin-antitoxin stability system
MAPTKQSVIELAQRTANREGKSMAVLNLNSFSPLYVVRDWRDGLANYSGLAGHGELVARIDPVQRPKLSEEQAKIISMSRWLAKKAIKEERRRQKIKLSHCEPAELRRAADAYLEDHRDELIEKARAWLSELPS